MNRLKTFKRIYIEITNCCNLSCSFCPPSKRKQEFMSLEAFEKVLKKLQGHGQFVYLHIKGEPMLHPQFMKILDLCELYGLKVNLTTNGTFLGEYGQQLLRKKALRQLSISLQSQENMEDADGFKQYMSDVLAMIVKGQAESPVIFELRLWNYEDLVNNQSSKNQLALQMIMDELDVSYESLHEIPKGKGSKLKPQVYLSKSLEFQWPDLLLDPINDVGTCYGLRQQVGILVNGDVVPCCLDSEGGIVLGNIFESSFEDIVTSKRAKAMVKGFENRKITEELCKRCGYRSKFD